MKEITLVGMFSNADWCKPGKSETVLAKQIESVLKNKDYSINKILLIYGYQYINGMPAVSNEEIKKNLSYTAEIISDERAASYLKNQTIRTIIQEWSLLMDSIYGQTWNGNSLFLQ